MDVCEPLPVGANRTARRIGVPRRRRACRWGRAIAGAVLLSGAGGGAAFAGDDPTVLARLTPFQEAQDADNAPSLQVGSLFLAPTVTAGGTFDTNVFATPDHERSDWFFSLRPRLDIQSNWPRNAFALRAEGDFRQYATFGSENQNNLSVAGTGRFDLAPNAYLLAGGGYQLLHEDRGALVPVNGVHPTQYTVTSGKTGFVIEPEPMGVRLDATVDSYAYNNITLGDGTPVQETARDRIVYALSPQVTYRIVPQYDAFLRAVVNRRQYNSTREPDGLDRSSTGYTADIGGSLHLSGFATGEFYVGYLEQDYDSAAVKPIGAFHFGGSLAWRPVPETAFRIELSRSIEESTFLGSQGYLQTALRLGVEHQLMPRLLLDGSIGFINADFAGNVGSSDLYDLKLGARYLIDTNFSAGLEYILARRDSSASLPSYTRQIIELTLHGRL